MGSGEVNLDIESGSFYCINKFSPEYLLPKLPATSPAANNIIYLRTLPFFPFLPP